MLTIGIDYTPAYEQGGGIGRYVRDLMTALFLEDTDSSYRLFVAGAAKTQLPDPPASNVEWRPTSLTPRWLARIWHRMGVPLPVETFTGRVDLFHATDFVLPPTLPSTRTIVQVHDLSFARVPEAATPRLKVYLDRVVPASARRANHILADSQATKDDLQELYNIPAEKVTVLYGGVDSRFRPQPVTSQEMIRQKYNLDTFPFILSVGTVQPRKNYERLILALADLRRNGNDIHLVIAGGRGWLDAPIYETVKSANVEAFVHFIGFADDEDLPTLYSAATCFAYPSLYEGFGLPVLEAMACETPVLTSNVSSMPEAAGEAAILVDPFDTQSISHELGRMINDSQLQVSLMNKGIEHAKTFSWQKSAQKLKEIYAKML